MTNNSIKFEYSTQEMVIDGFFNLIKIDRFKDSSQKELLGIASKFSVPIRRSLVFKLKNNKNMDQETYKKIVHILAHDDNFSVKDAAIRELGY